MYAMKDEILTKRFGVPQGRIDALREHNKEHRRDSDNRLCHTHTGHCWRLCQICEYSTVDLKKYPCNKCDNHFSMYKKKED